MQVQHTDPRIGLIAVGFSPPEALAGLAEHLDWQAPFLSDENRLTYQALGLERASLRYVFSPGTLAVYAKAIARGQKLHAPVEDTRQLGGDGIIRDGTLVRRWRPPSPDDRVDPTTLLDEAARIAGS